VYSRYDDAGEAGDWPGGETTAVSERVIVEEDLRLAACVLLDTLVEDDGVEVGGLGVEFELDERLGDIDGRVAEAVSY